MTERPGLLVRLVQWAAWPLLLAPLTILLHELGHLAAAIALGIPDPVLHFSFVSSGDTSAVPGWQIGLFGIAGPLVTAAMLLAGVALIVRRPERKFGYGLAVAAALRFFVAVPYTIGNIVALIAGFQLQPPAFDEYKAGQAFGWSGDLLLGSTAFLFFLVIAVLVMRLPKGERLAGWIGLIGGTVGGWAAWFTLAPLALP